MLYASRHLLYPLCKGLPPEFGTLLCYCRNLKFDETPNYNYCRKLLRETPNNNFYYNYCRKLLREVFETNSYSLDYVYDWTIKQQSAEEGGASARPADAAAAPMLVDESAGGVGMTSGGNASNVRQPGTSTEGMADAPDAGLRDSQENGHGLFNAYRRRYLP
ncbi:hypothetical protein T484DRAFT_1833456 [Baffinella frigidus]|nr:hypothetical protein T484DRAFT_1833456 [Cryptophyta sp. CCMP2293]